MPETQNAPLTTVWPTNLLNDRKRALHILVKVQRTIDGAQEELKEAINKRWDEYQKLYDEVVTNKRSPSDPPTQKKFGEKTKKLVKAETVYGIALPIPNELTDNQSHKWETTEGAVASVANGLISGLGNLTTSKLPANISNVLGKLGANMSKSLGNVSSATGFRKPMIDPGYFQDYKGSEPRTFTFSWDLIPSNAEEADAIMTIIYNLKKYTLPTSIGGVALVSPYLFDITIDNERINAMMNMNNVVCTNMNINYSADGSVQLLPDGIPKYLKLEMTFAERSLVTSEFY